MSAHSQNSTIVPMLLFNAFTFDKCWAVHLGFRAGGVTLRVNWLGKGTAKKIADMIQTNAPGLTGWTINMNLALWSRYEGPFLVQFRAWQVTTLRRQRVYYDKARWNPDSGAKEGGVFFKVNWSKDKVKEMIQIRNTYRAELTGVRMEHGSEFYASMVDIRGRRTVRGAHGG
ncbi:hypothetical protein B0H66DRAFT_592223 [Apodospora peruviana]|uniref:Uncharacterized protein n=1 Tax=Apodospora peruviana TaxID=516989 RepID=A0AAE0M236_9PEZI|nr:hypothetical protein B0H66DRAFT_592223 [Apodospora peruviana]